MELSILNNILHGSLKPWLLDTSDKKKFSEWVKMANAISPVTYLKLADKSNLLLSEFPELKTISQQDKPKKDVPIQKLYFEIRQPIFTDSVNRFFSLLIDTETLRFSNMLRIKVSMQNELIDKHFSINQALRSVRILAQQSARELRERGGLSFPDAESTITHSVLFYLKQSLIALFFDIQEQYKTILVGKLITIEDFFNDVLEETYTGANLLQPTKAFFEHQINELLADGGYSDTKAKELLSKLQTLQTLQSLQTPLENLIFLHSLPAEKIPQTLAELSDPAFVKQQLSVAKNRIERSILKLPFGNERYSVIQEAIDDIDYIDSTNNKLSIPQTFSKWLLEQKAIYYSRFSEKFPVITSTDDKPQKASKNTFGFNGDETKLKNVIVLLDKKIELLDNTKTSPDELVAILTAKDFTKAKTKIYLGCETVQFRYIIDCLKVIFLNLTPKSIGKSGLFYSRGNRKMTDQNLYSNKIGSPKSKEDIDKIINHLK